MIDISTSTPEFPSAGSPSSRHHECTGHSSHVGMRSPHHLTSYAIKATRLDLLHASSSEMDVDSGARLAECLAFHLFADTRPS